MIAAVALFGLLPSASAAPVLTPVRIDLVEALSPTDTTSSLRFQKEFEQAIQTSRTQLEKRLSKCGYRLEPVTNFFDANDPLQAKEKAASAHAANSWVIIGPRRSNHYLLLAKGSGSTPTVSLMASASEISDLGPRHTSLSPRNSEMASAAVLESKARTSKRAKFATIVNQDCVSCMDFAESYQREAAKHGLRHAETWKVSGETPAMAEIAEKIRSLKPEIVVVPNFSKTAAHIIAALAEKNPKVLFVGSDGWGDSKFGFLQNDSSVQSAKGITVRGFPPVNEGLKSFRLGKEIKRSGLPAPTGGPGLGIVKSFDSIADILCEARPKDRAEFANAFERNAAKLSAPFGVSVYELANSNIVYGRRARAR